MTCSRRVSCASRCTCGCCARRTRAPPRSCCGRGDGGVQLRAAHVSQPPAGQRARRVDPAGRPRRRRRHSGADGAWRRRPPTRRSGIDARRRRRRRVPGHRRRPRAARVRGAVAVRARRAGRSCWPTAPSRSGGEAGQPERRAAVEGRAARARPASARSSSSSTSSAATAGVRQVEGARTRPGPHHRPRRQRQRGAPVPLTRHASIEVVRRAWVFLIFLFVLLVPARAYADANVTIKINDSAPNLNPAQLNPGGTVTWRNDDGVNHEIEIKSGPTVAVPANGSSQPLVTSQAFDYTVDNGSFEYSVVVGGPPVGPPATPPPATTTTTAPPLTTTTTTIAPATTDTTTTTTSTTTSTTTTTTEPASASAAHPHRGLLQRRSFGRAPLADRELHRRRRPGRFGLLPLVAQR